MKSNYQYALTEMLKDEGGYTNDPKDPGGPTNFGITIADYRKYIKPNATATDVKNMKVEEAKSVYKPKYWDAVNGDGLPSGVDYCVFDYGVNSGVNRANKILAKLTNTDAVKTINSICDERLAFLQSLPTWGRFGKGWGTRVANVRHKSIVLATAKPHTVSNTVTNIAAGGAGTIVAIHYLPLNSLYLIPIAVTALAVAGLAIYIYERYQHAKQS